MVEAPPERLTVQNFYPRWLSNTKSLSSRQAIRPRSSVGISFESVLGIIIVSTLVTTNRAADTLSLLTQRGLELERSQPLISQTPRPTSYVSIKSSPVTLTFYLNAPVFWCFPNRASQSGTLSGQHQWNEIAAICASGVRPGVRPGNSKNWSRRPERLQGSQWDTAPQDLPFLPKSHSNKAH